MLVLEAEAVPGIEKGAGVEFASAFVEDELSAVEVAAEGEVEMVLGGGGGVVGAEEMMFGGLGGLGDGAVDGAIRVEQPGGVFEPASARIQDGSADFGEADPVVVVSADGAEGGDVHEFPDERLQGVEGAAGVDEVTAEEDEIGGLAGGDLGQALEDVGRAVFFEMEVAGEEDAFAEAEPGDGFPANEQRAAGAEFELEEPLPQPIHLGKRSFRSAAARVQVGRAARAKGMAARSRTGVLRICRSRLSISARKGMATPMVEGLARKAVT